MCIHLSQLCSSWFAAVIRNHRELNWHDPICADLPSMQRTHNKFGRQSSTVKSPSTWPSAAGIVFRLLITISEILSIGQLKQSVTLLNLQALYMID